MYDANYSAPVALRSSRRSLWCRSRVSHRHRSLWRPRSRKCRSSRLRRRLRYTPPSSNPVHPTFLKSLTCNSPDVPRSVVEQENGGAIRHRRWRRDHMHPPITPEPNTAHTSFLTGANGPPSLSLCPLSSLDCYVILYHVLYLYHKRCKVPYLHYATFYIYIMIPPKYDTGACLVLSRESRQDKRRQDLRNRRFAL